MALEKVIRDARCNIRGTIYTTTLQLIVYADDLVITGRTVNIMKETPMALDISARKMGLAINE
jgi:hypothetical protein